MCRQASVLLIDDDPATAPTVESVLLREGYQVDRAQRGKPALEQVRRDPPDLVILGIDKSNGGWTFCRQLLNCFDGALFLLLASNAEVQRVKGLTMGAVDCLSKPFAILEFVARVRAILRRCTSRTARAERAYLVDAELVVDLTHQEVWRDGQIVSLTPIESRLLACLLDHSGQVVPHAHLLRGVWGPGHERKPNALWVHIRNLRQKLEPDPKQPQRIVNCPRKGYMFQQLAERDGGLDRGRRTLDSR